MAMIHLVLTYGLKREYQEYRIFIEMDLLKEAAPLKVYESAYPPAEDLLPGVGRLDRIFERGTVRVGYFRDALPFAFRNADGRMVGLDIEMAHQLARDMNVSLELVIVKRDEIPEMLKSGQIDIVMSGVPIEMSRAGKVTFSTPYMEQTLAFLVEDHKRETFSDWDNVRNMDDLKLAMIDLPYYTSRIRHALPQADIEFVDTPREFFQKKKGKLDAFLYWAEAGSAWSLVYPGYSVAVPHPRIVAMPIAYPMPREARDMVQYVNTWIELKKRDQTLEDLHNYWILGKEAVKREPRWSIIRDLLHWVD
jgi:ABC-type amino acid transport substrate-binding protein